MKVNEKLSVTFLLKKSRPNVEGLLPITVRLTIDGLRAEFFLGKLVDPDFWNQKANRIVTKGYPDPKQARFVNNAITQCLALLETYYDMLRREYSVVTSELLKQKYTGELDAKIAKEAQSKERTLCQFCNYKYSKFAVLVKGDERSFNTLKRWRTTKKKIRHFLKFKFKKWDVPLCVVKYANANDFLHFVLTKQGIGENTASK